MNSPHELAQLLAAMRALRNDAEPRAALATLTRTRGSTFRRPGTHMLVLGDGSVVCELSGGCPQRDIVARALEVIASGEPRLVNYNSESGLDVLMEMGCGGELEILIEPMAPREATDFADSLAACLEQRIDACLATVFAIDGRVVAPRRMVWSAAQTLFDGCGCQAISRTVANACAARHARGAVTLCLPSPQGTLDVLIESVHPPHALVVIGSSAAARALLSLSTALGWQTTLVDHDPARLQSPDL
ncbi:MAG TPA: XdhC family protein, partial [Dyella sp.]|nr:XdhC family protein [Dyella sp.]